MRRTLILTALLLAFGWASGNARDEGNYTIEIPIDFPEVDSSLIIEAAGGKINDSLFFASPTFYYDGPWTNLVVNFVVETKDTATATGLSHDSVTIKLQTKQDEDSAKHWNTIGATSKYPLAAWDSTGTAAAVATHLGSDGDGQGFITSLPISIAGIGSPYRGVPVSRINLIDSDSVQAVGTLFRFLTLYSANVDSIRSHIGKNYAAFGDSTTVDILSKLKAICMFHLR